MFQRIVTGDAQIVCTIAAFAVAASIFAAVAWRAIRMRPSRAEEMSSLPFATPTPASNNERTEER